MRWDQTVRGAIFAAIPALVSLLPAAFADGNLSLTEVWMFSTTFFGAFFAYLKDHPPTF